MAAIFSVLKIILKFIIGCRFPENIYTYNKTSKNPKFKINDLVRISLKRRPIFDKPSSNIKWSEELFKIHSINRSNVVTYKIKDLNNEIIDGVFYERELQKTKNTSEVYVIEKIIRKTKTNTLLNGGIILMILIVGLIKMI